MSYRLIIFITTILVSQNVLATPGSVRLKDLLRVEASRDNQLIGYGIVTGLAGTGDSQSANATKQSISNTLRKFGVNVDARLLRSRNSASVMITANLPPYAQAGDKIDVNVTSMGDARSLVSGTLLLTHLVGSDNQIYALTQGPLSVGGYRYDTYGNVVQKNHMTTAQIPGGATIEKTLNNRLTDVDHMMNFILHEPDFTTARRISRILNKHFGQHTAKTINAAHIKIAVPQSYHHDVVDFIAEVESLRVKPDARAVVVVNERTGTVVSGGNVRVSKVNITHGDLKVAIRTKFEVSQPIKVFASDVNASTVVVPNTQLEVDEQLGFNVNLPNDSSVSDLVAALNKVKASSRDIITILQAIKRSGALHADLIIQ